MGITNKSIWIADASAGKLYNLAMALAAGNHLIASSTDEAGLMAMVHASKGRILKLPLARPESQPAKVTAAKLDILTDSLDIAIIAPAPAHAPELLRKDSDIGEFLLAHYFTSTISSVELALPLLRRAARPQLIVAVDFQISASISQSACCSAVRQALDSYARQLAMALKREAIDVSLLLDSDNNLPIHSANNRHQRKAMTNQQIEKILDRIQKRHPTIQLSEPVNRFTRYRPQLVPFSYRAISHGMARKGEKIR